ncbi:hypothetical protein WJX84_006230 [Apatococcus fuscideae]|uniref:NADH:ubiquinone reductase (non-electrogenic) n=1 Tax=Apatococcus fuscideae TaxID=2026836 RepID=A0AAW1TBS2_9CHLO
MERTFVLLPSSQTGPRKCSNKYELILVSPRNYFLYTPLLPAVATGTIEQRSIVEPVRKIMRNKGKYYEAICQDIDPKNKNIVACFPKDTGLEEACFRIPYDILVVAVGSINNTFGCPGVEENTFFFKSITDANKLRRQVSECFERASLPELERAERQKLLSFVVVGGGPTGVEVAAELHDMIDEDLSRLYPELIQDVRIRIIELQDHLLSTYDRAISNYTAKTFKRAGIEAMVNSKVQEVRRGAVIVKLPDGSTQEVPFGACVWSTGVAIHPLMKQLQERLPEGTQTNFRSILTDGYLRAEGSNGSIFAVGDASSIAQPRAMQMAGELFTEADINKDGKLQLSELRMMLNKASSQYSHFAEHARFLDGKYGVYRWGNMVKGAVESANRLNPVARKQQPGTGIMAELNENSELTEEQFVDLLKKIDNGLRALPATAQVAKQQGEFVAHLMHKHRVRPGEVLPKDAKAFKYSHKGSLAYVGKDRAVMDVPGVSPLTGYGAGLLWRGFETYSQISFRNLFLVSVDWVRTKAFGRDISRV